MLKGKAASIKFSLRFFLYRLNAVFPKKNTLWLASSWYGERYSDNSRYLFEYVLKHELNIRIFWITRNLDLYQQLRYAKTPVVYAKSLRALWLILRAKVYVFSSSLQDVSSFGVSANTFSLQLWHGSPLKKICCDDPIEWKHLNSAAYKHHLSLHPFDAERYNAVIAPSSYFQNIFQSAFRLQSQHFPILGYPRIDRLLLGVRPYSSTAPMLLYAPTFRGSEGVMRALSDKAMPQQAQLETLDKLFYDYHAHMEIQYHPVDAKSRLVAGFNCIHSIEKYDDFYEYLQKIDILITDYSGLMFDFLLTKKPVICVISDIETYVSQDRELYRHPSEVPGLYVCKTWDEVHETLEKIFKEGPSPEKILTDEQLSEIYGFQDCLSSKRIVEYVVADSKK
ncbi:MAG: CDP-glycerol glycerophosphotransferase family protein [Pseudomonadota bacterium]